MLITGNLSPVHYQHALDEVHLQTSARGDRHHKWAGTMGMACIALNVLEGPHGSVQIVLRSNRREAVLTLYCREIFLIKCLA
jgi:hypothetical protein